MPLGLKHRTELILILLLCAGGTLQGQTVEGSLRLQIEDGTGPVEGAAAEVVREETNRLRTGVADRDGHLLIPLLPSGTYRLEVSHAGYRKHVEKFSLRVNERLELRVTLQPGELTEEVLVVESRGGSSGTRWRWEASSRTLRSRACLWMGGTSSS